MHIPRYLRPLTTDQMTPALWAPKKPAIRRYTRDAMMTLDQETKDSAGAFFISELERLDPTMHDPLVAVFWNRDIDLREDVTLGDELTSFTLNNYAAPGGITPGGKAWIGKDTNTIASIALDIGKEANPLYLWGMEMSYSIPELASAARLGRSLDTAKADGIKLKHQMDIDEMVYIGDSALGNFGLVNHPKITPTNVAAGVGGTTWNLKTPDEILADINTVLTNAWAATGWTIAPTDIRIPPSSFSYLVNNKVSNAGNLSILNYLAQNNISAQQNGGAIRILPLKWLTNRGVGSTNRLLAYTKKKDFVRYPMTTLQRTNPEARAISLMTYFYCRLGVVEIVYPETMAYLDGI